MRRRVAWAALLGGAMGAWLGGAARAEPFEACAPAPARHAAAAERELSLETPDGRLEGVLAQPEGAAPRALAVMLHGYTGARDEIPVAGGEGMFARAARRLAERGVATLRIDFLGSGRSDGDWADTRFSGQARDARRAAAALREAFAAAAGAPLGVLGYSQGGMAALRAGGAFDRVALWAPVLDPMATYGIIFGRETIAAGAAAAARGETAIVAGTRLRPGFFAELAAADPVADGARVAAPVWVATGRRDPLIKDGAALAARLAEARRAEARRGARRGATTVLDLEAGHDLGALRAPALLDRVIDCTAGFLLGAD
ncbi:MAG: alpha/beta hydrolase [Pseudomonadota bacterium]